MIAVQPAPAVSQTLPAALTVDPPRDATHPARLEQLRYPSHGVEIPARLFVAAGAGAHPTLLLLHGFPGTELNLDLARVFQRDGWNVLAIHYRGVWGAPGQFSLTHVVEDAQAALAWLRSPAANSYGVDPKHIVVLGHSMGGFATVMLGEDKCRRLRPDFCGGHGDEHAPGNTHTQRSRKFRRRCELHQCQSRQPYRGRPFSRT
jgi:acetyl esterase/lipase